jgi:hypothetical protein
MGAAIAVMDQPGRGPALLQGHADRVEDELTAQMIGHGPSHDPARAGIDDHGQVKEALPGPQIGDIRDPQPVRHRCAELAVDPVRSDRAGAQPGAFLALAAAVHALDAGQAHQPGYPLTVPTPTLLLTVLLAVADLSSQPARAVDAAVLEPGRVQLVGGVGVVEFLIAHGRLIAAKPDVERRG